MKAMPKSEKPLDYNEWAYKIIKMKILEHDLAAGSRLNIEELSQQLNISKTPIREALLRLTQNNLVVSVSRSGYYVCGITREDFDNLFELRQLVESFAVEKFVESASESAIADLVKINDRCKATALNGNIKAFNALDIQMHETYIEMLGNRQIQIIYNNLYDLLFRIRIYALKSLDNVMQSVNEHERVVDAVKRREAALARRQMKDHIMNIRERLLPIVNFQDVHWLETINRRSDD